MQDVLMKLTINNLFKLLCNILTLIMPFDYDATESLNIGLILPDRLLLLHNRLSFFGLFI